MLRGNQGRNVVLAGPLARALQGLHIKIEGILVSVLGFADRSQAVVCFGCVTDKPSGAPDCAPRGNRRWRRETRLAPGTQCRAHFAPRESPDRGGALLEARGGRHPLRWDRRAWLVPDRRAAARPMAAWDATDSP